MVLWCAYCLYIIIKAYYLLVKRSLPEIETCSHLEPLSSWIMIIGKGFFLLMTKEEGE